MIVPLLDKLAVPATVLLFIEVTFPFTLMKPLAFMATLFCNSKLPLTIHTAQLTILKVILFPIVALPEVKVSQAFTFMIQLFLKFKLPSTLKSPFKVKAPEFSTNKVYAVPSAVSVILEPLVISRKPLPATLKLVSKIIA